MSFIYYVDRKKLRIKPEESYIRINGWCFDKENKEVKYRVFIDGKESEFILKRINRKDVANKYKKFNTPLNSGFHIKVYLKQGYVPKKCEVYAIAGNEQKKIINYNDKMINSIIDRNSISYNIDNVYAYKNKMSIQGWAITKSNVEAVKITITNESGKDLIISRKDIERQDLVDEGFVKESEIACGFDIEYAIEQDEIAILTITDKNQKIKKAINPVKVKKINARRAKIGFLRQFGKNLNLMNIRKGVLYIKGHGIKGLKEKIKNKVNHTGKDYATWYEENKVTQEELKEQRKHKFDYSPKISIVTPTYKTPETFLNEMIESVRSQSYENWELCIADGSEGDKLVEERLAYYAGIDKRIKYKILDKNLGIAGNTNAALELAIGDYVGLFDHDDLLEPNALFEIVQSLQDKQYDIIYTDEDKVNGDATEHMDPNFKPDYSPDLFTSHNYITHFFVVKRTIIEKVGGFREAFDGSQDYDIMFRCIEEATSIKHIPKILYNWRIHMNSVAGDPSSKMYAYEAGRKAIQEHFDRKKIAVDVEMLDLWGMYRVHYKMEKKPLVSIIIPNKDHTKDLDLCISSIVQKSTYKNIEFIIVENNSTEKETFAYYEEAVKKYPNCKVVTWEKEFNYSAINNFGVTKAKGEYLLFLNNDTEMIAPEAIEELVSTCMRDDVGVVGAKLLYEDDTVQHAGIVLGFGNYAGHVNNDIGKDDYGYMVRARVTGNYSAVTAACLITKKSLFEQVGGFDERFVVACNDVDYCLKVRKENYVVVFNAFSLWYHYESKSRGYEDTPEKIKRFQGEIGKFQEKWQKVLDAGDPYYNANFDLNQAPFTLS
ncbi:MAG TPA: glycosyltransferase family 2 protein [Candidatus Dorea intestinavium]|nr:glycosyltransferase family 2 protein [Candidatus Dorea intestinavium]